MLIFRKEQLRWFALSVAILAAATASYFIWPGRGHHRLNGPSGGSAEGLIFGSVGSVFMLFALLLGLRKRFRTMRIGTAFWWLKGHAWLGLLSYPIILYHAGFKPHLWGGLLTQVIMWVFLVVILSGIWGLVAQQFLPNKLLRDVPMETIFEQIHHILQQLRDESRAMVESVVKLTEEQAYDVEVVPAGARAGTLVPERVTTANAQRVKAFYDAQVVPFLGHPMPRDGRLATEASAEKAFAELEHEPLPAPLAKVVAALREVVKERRQLHHQRRLHLWMHAWLFVHVPLSYGLVAMSTVHAVMALRYTSAPSWVLPLVAGCVAGLALICLPAALVASWKVLAGRGRTTLRRR